MNCFRFSGSCDAGDVLRRDRRTADDEDVHARVDDGLGELGRALRGERGGGDHARVAHLLDALPDQLLLDGGRVDLLEAAGRGLARPARRSRRAAAAGPRTASTGLRGSARRGRPARRCGSRWPGRRPSPWGRPGRAARSGRRRSARRSRPPSGPAYGGWGRRRCRRRRTPGGRACRARSRSQSRVWPFPDAFSAFQYRRRARRGRPRSLRGRPRPHVAVPLCATCGCSSAPRPSSGCRAGGSP